MATEISGIKRIPLDEWSIREQVWLAMAVDRCGDQNWVSVSRALRPLAAEAGRPPDWFGHRSCAAQYGALLERAAEPRRKKRTSSMLSGSATPPPASPAPALPPAPAAILRRLTADRVAELHSIMREEARLYAEIKEEVNELMLSTITESRIRQIAANIDTEILSKEKEAAKHVQWLREREERRKLIERTWRRPDNETPQSSPLLTSLLQSSISVNRSLSEGTSPTTVCNPPVSKSVDVSNILENTNTPQSADKVPFHELQKIEQIKSELQKIEQNLIVGALPTESNMINVLPLHNSTVTELPSTKDPPHVDTQKTPEKIDIDDIEIKAEDVYAFSDIDLDIPPVSTIHKPIGRVTNSDKNLFNKKELTDNVSNLEDVVHSPEHENLSTLNVATRPNHTTPVSGSEVSTVDQSNAILPTDTSNITNSTDQVNQDETISRDMGGNNSVNKDNVNEIVKVEIETISKSETDVPEGYETKNEHTEVSSVIDVKKSPEVVDRIDSIELTDKIILQEQKIFIGTPEILETKEPPNDSIKDDETNEIKPIEQVESHTETDDDTPIEVIKEDKPGKTKRDYSRKKVEKEERITPSKEIDIVISHKIEYGDEASSDNSQESADKKTLSRRFKSDVGGSRSESPATTTDSLPNSPGPVTPPTHVSQTTTQMTTEQDKDYRIWKKSINLALNRLYALKYASLFHRPITDDQAPGYSQVVKKPMDLSTIRRNIDLGVIKTTKEFQYAVMLMLTNALMYNPTDHRVYTMTYETIHDAISELNLLLQAQAHAAANNAASSILQNQTLSRLTRPPRPASRSAGTQLKRKRGSVNTDTPTTGKKRRIDET